MSVFTVIGIYADNLQRYATVVEAATPEAAEQQAVEAVERDTGDDLLLVAGVIAGAHQCQDA